MVHNIKINGIDVKYKFYKNLNLKQIQILCRYEVGPTFNEFIIHLDMCDVRRYKDHGFSSSSSMIRSKIRDGLNHLSKHAEIELKRQARHKMTDRKPKHSGWKPSDAQHQ